MEPKRTLALSGGGSIAPASAQAKPEGAMRWAPYVTLAPLEDLRRLRGRE